MGTFLSLAHPNIFLSKGSDKPGKVQNMQKIIGDEDGCKILARPTESLTFFSAFNCESPSPITIICKNLKKFIHFFYRQEFEL